jgi:regulator of sirC expression with transglutaminase-like and TPR domain
MSQASNPTQHFAAELTLGDPVRLALAIARIAYPDLDSAQYLESLDEMTRMVEPRVAEAPLGGARALALIQAMRLDLGMRGNIDRYHDAANSFLNLVIDRRTGLPIMLSLVLVAVGKRLGLAVDGAGFPGHFMVRYQDGEGTWFLDPFHGAVMTADDVPAYFMKLFGQSSLKMEASYFEAFPASAWAQRILNNLHSVYLNAGDLPMLSKVLMLMLVLEAERPELWRELGLVQYRRGELTEAGRALRRYFYFQGLMVLSAPNSSMPPVTPDLSGDDQQIWQLLEEIEAARIRWN